MSDELIPDVPQLTVVCGRSHGTNRRRNEVLAAFQNVGQEVMQVVRTTDEQLNGRRVNDVVPVRWMTWNNEPGIPVRCRNHGYLLVTEREILDRFRHRRRKTEVLVVAATRKLPERAAGIISQLLNTGTAPR